LTNPAVSTSRWDDIAELTKPGIVVWVLITVAAGFFLASPEALAGLTLFHTLLAAAAVATASNALNQVAERDVDRMMDRTRNRPLAAGRMTPRGVVRFSVVTGVAGVVWFAVFTTPLTTVLGAATLGLYVFAYTPLKRHTSLATLVGAVPGALPILGGWAATGRPLDATAWALFGLVFCWQLPHFLALAWIFREDYARAGLKMLSVTSGRAATFRQALAYGVALLPIGVVPAAVGSAGLASVVGTLGLGGWVVVATIQAGRSGTVQHAWRLFGATIVYLPAVLALLVLEQLLG
jgi:protoheme IX farnesyltransferase